MVVGIVKLVPQHLGHNVVDLLTQDFIHEGFVLVVVPDQQGDLGRVGLNVQIVGVFSQQFVLVGDAAGARVVQDNVAGQWEVFCNFIEAESADAVSLNYQLLTNLLK